MNTRKKQAERKNQRPKTVVLQPSSKKQFQSWDMWEALHDGLRNHEHERPETRMTR